MNDANATPWAGLVIMAVTAVVIFGLVLLLGLLVRFVVGVRDDLRDRYFGGRWSPCAIDFLGIPAWVGLEAICVLGALLFALITVWAIHGLARDFRDWWHQNDRGR